jgi:hypothetical protein
MAKATSTEKKTTTTEKKTAPKIDKELEKFQAENELLRKKLNEMKEMFANFMKKEDQPLNDFDEYQDIHSRYRVNVTSLYHGGLNLQGINGKNIRFDRFGQKRTLYFEDVESIASNNESFIRNGLVFIHDDRVLKLIYLDNDYDKVIEPETLKNIFTLPVEEIKKLYNNVTKDLKKEILFTFAEWINKNDPFYLDKNKIEAINEVSGENVIKIAESLKEYEK